MWFLLSLLALFMLVARRTTEKKIILGIDSATLTWLQQAVAIPFILVSLLFTKFYLPSELSLNFWLNLSLYVALLSFDIFCYFRALRLANISFVAPLLSLTVVGNVVGAYFILSQKPSTYGVLGALATVIGAFFIAKRSRGTSELNRSNEIKALLYVLAIVLERSVTSNIELFMLRQSNPTSFNFYSSFFTVWFVLIITLSFNARNKIRYQDYWLSVKKSFKKHKTALAVIGSTYTINMLATYSAKIIAPNAGYVGAVKQSQAIPMVLIGVMFLNEKFTSRQFVGLAFMFIGLVLLGIN